MTGLAMSWKEADRFLVRRQANDDRPGDGQETAVEAQLAAMAERLGRMEAEHREAMALMCQALGSMQQSRRAEKAARHADKAEIVQQFGRLSQDLAAARRQHVQDDEAMRERLFTLAETVEGVRAAAAGAVRPSELAKFENTISAELDRREDALCARITERFMAGLDAVADEAAGATDTLKEEVATLSDRVDVLSDTMVLFAQAEAIQSSRAAMFSLSGFGAAARDGEPADLEELPEEFHPCSEDEAAIIDFVLDDEATSGAEFEAPPEIPAVIPFQPRDKMRPAAQTAPENSNPPVTEETAKAGRPVRRAAAGTVGMLAVVAALTLLAGPSLQASTPARAEEASPSVMAVGIDGPVQLKLRTRLSVSR